MKIELKGEDLYDAVDSAKEIDCEPWRWGTTHTYVVERDGKHFMFTVQRHSQDGLQGADYGVDAVEVRPVEKVVTTTVWEVVPSEPSSTEPTK